MRLLWHTHVLRTICGDGECWNALHLIQRFMVGGVTFSFRALMVGLVEIPMVVLPLSVKPVFDGLFR